MDEGAYLSDGLVPGCAGNAGYSDWLEKGKEAAVFALQTV
jgi:hypothetical protein